MISVADQEPIEQVETGVSRTDPAFAEWVEELAERLRAGDPVDLEALARAHPEWAERLRRLMPAIAAMADLGRSAAVAGDGGPIPSACLGPAGLGELGDFRIVREIGRGGMGIVYEAEQVSLGRRVALKVLPLGGAMDSKQLQRFQLEARAAACLHHTNIVSVHAVGCERGVPFYVMQFIEGRSLAQLIAELRWLEGREPADEATADMADNAIWNMATGLASERFSQVVEAAVPTTPGPGASVPPTSACDAANPYVPGLRASGEHSASSSTCSREYVRTVAQFGVQVAEALDYAHTRGILHRDIKPGNLLLDDQGQLWVTDFGLAQIQGNPALTLTGDVLGTLRYMSPEQALAKRVVIDGRTDIYSLGVTLYELLTLRPAVEGQDRQEILRSIAQEEPPPPRKINPAVARDLETVVMKAMAKEPSGRYGTAKELADELRRFLEDKLITARRPSLLDRSVKWARRHRAAVWPIGVSGAVLLLMAVVGLATSNVLITREWNQKDHALKDRETALAAAESNLLLARQAVDDMYTPSLRTSPASRTCSFSSANFSRKRYGSISNSRSAKAAIRSSSGRRRPLSSGSARSSTRSVATGRQGRPLKGQSRHWKSWQPSFVPN
jgi:serine/threonine-protein kinase